MKEKSFGQEKKEMFLYSIGFDVLCFLVSLIVIGLRWEFVIGILTGTIIVFINLNIMEKIVNIALLEDKSIFAFLLRLGRFFLYAIVIYACYKIGLIALIGFSMGVISLTVAAVINYRKGGGK